MDSRWIEGVPIDDGWVITFHGVLLPGHHRGAYTLLEFGERQRSL
jgi:hypothetical protein